jgi:6-phosphogluconolactonase
VTPSPAPRLPRPSLALALAALAVMAACQPGTSPHPVAPSAGFTVSGRIAGTASAGATVRLQGGFRVLRFAVADADGRFTFADLERGEYDVTPLGSAEVAFAPAARRATVVAGDVTGLDFVSSAANVVQGTIAGVGASEVVVTLEGPVSATRATDAAGAYRAAGLPDGTYLVRAAAAPLAPLRSLQPNGAEVTVRGGVTATRDFRAVAATGLHALSGTVTGVATAGVEVRLLGDGDGFTRTDADGRYAFAGLADGSYRVVGVPPDGALFRQRDRAAALAGADVAGVDLVTYAPRSPRFAYLAAWTSSAGTETGLYQFAIGADGGLTPLSPAVVATPGRFIAAATDPSGRFVYAVNEGPAELRQYAVGVDGQLVPLATSAVSIDANTALLAVAPGGGWLWTYSNTTRRVLPFAIGADGSVEPRPAQALDVGQAASGMAVHPSGATLYLAATLTGLVQYAVGADGSLAPLATPVANAPADALGQVWTATEYAAVTVEPSGRYAYASIYDRSGGGLKAAVCDFAVRPDGGLAPIGRGAYTNGSIIYNGTTATSLAPDPGGRTLFAGYRGHLVFPTEQIYQYALAPGGAVGTAPTTTLGGPNQFALVVHPSGRFLYAANASATAQYPPGGVTWLAVGPDGLATQAGSLAAGYWATALVLAGQ